MNLVNIYSKGREIYLFLRDKQGNLEIRRDASFFPYYYDQCPEGICAGYDGTKLKKLYLSSPQEVAERRNNASYEADILFTKRYVIDKVAEITPTTLRWNMVDMEILIPRNEVPKPLETKKAPYPISCIVLYDNLTDRYHTWYLGDFKNESDLWLAFCNHLQNNPPDLLIAHNMNGFDYPYWFYRIPDFARRISPINQTRYGTKDFIFPAGISIIDSLEWWKKYTLNKEESYALESLMEKYLGYGKGKYKNIDFFKLSPDIVGRCQGDVRGMVELEKKMQMIPHYDLIRRISHIEWEDINWNSRIIDMFLLRQAKKCNVVLPMKPRAEEIDDEEFEGAFRDAFETGAFYGIGKYDLSGAYCYAIIDLCLDSVNIVDTFTENCISVEVKSRITQTVEKTYFVKQNPDALLPRVVKQLVDEKNKLKKSKEEANPESSEYEDIEKRYNAFKTIVLSAWGVIGNKYFRLYDSRVASMITAVVRDLLHYVLNELKEAGYKVIYIDTDSAFINDGGENISDFLNKLVEQWAVEKFGKKVTIEFDYEGHFQKLLILAKCRYIGYLKGSKGIKKEIKGVEAKRKDSTKFMKKFQEELIDKILNKESKEGIMTWISERVEGLRNESLENIAFPCSLSKKPGEYASYTKPLQALDNSPGFKKDIGDRFYYIYVEPEYYTEEREIIEYYVEVPGKRAGTVKKEKLTKKKLDVLCHPDPLITKMPDVLVAEGKIRKEARIQRVKKVRDVMAFDEDRKNHLRPIDWSQVIRRNITLKLETIFQAMGWQEDLKHFGIDIKETNEDAE